MLRAMNDTSPQAQAVMDALLRAASPGRGAAMAFALTEATVRWSRNAVRESMPGASEQEVLLRWVRLTYGAEIEARLRRDGRKLGG
jgi:hypothetical protein